MKNANMPAMPVTDENGMPFNDAPTEVCSMGLTKREHFAALAMQGFAVNHNHDPDGAAFDAVRWADALLEELEAAK